MHLLAKEIIGRLVSACLFLRWRCLTAANKSHVAARSRMYLVLLIIKFVVNLRRLKRKEGISRLGVTVKM
jgi:hypothetical protein